MAATVPLTGKVITVPGISGHFIQTGPNSLVQVPGPPPSSTAQYGSTPTSTPLTAPVAPQLVPQPVFAAPAPTPQNFQLSLGQAGGQVLGGVGAVGGLAGSNVGGQLVTLQNGQQAIVRAAQPQMMQLAPQPILQYMQMQIPVTGPGGQTSLQTVQVPVQVAPQPQ